MRVRTMFAASVIAAAALGVIGLPAVADSSTGPSVQVASVERSGNAAAVSGTAAFPQIGELSVKGENASITPGAVAGTPAGDAAGLKLTDAVITPLPDNAGLRFSWVVESLPAQTPPEGVRYNWAFQIGDRLYQLQAKRTNMVNVTTIEDPVGHVQHAATGESFFQLRGNCTAAYLGTSINGCYHLAFLKGSFDVEAKKVSIDLPFETRDGIGRLVAPDFKPGAVLVDNAGTGTAGMVVTASFQAVVSNTYVSRYINGIDPYFVGPQVHLGVGPAETDPTFVDYTARAVLANGTFSGTVDGLTAKNTTVFVRACNGTLCAYQAAPAPAE